MLLHVVFCQLWWKKTKNGYSLAWIKYEIVGLVSNLPSRLHYRIWGSCPSRGAQQTLSWSEIGLPGPSIVLFSLSVLFVPLVKDFVKWGEQRDRNHRLPAPPPTGWMRQGTKMRKGQVNLKQRKKGNTPHETLRIAHSDGTLLVFLSEPLCNGDFDLSPNGSFVCAKCREVAEFVLASKFDPSTES